MTSDALLALWTVPPGERDNPLAAFGEVYANPVLINGSPMPLPDLVDRARALHAAFDQHSMQLVDQVESPGKLAIAFRHSARHVGPLATPVGTIAATDKTVAGIGIDILTISDGRITQIWVLDDELQRLLQVHGGPWPAAGST